VLVRILGEDLATVGRPLDIERLLRNLIENAVRHSSEGASVEVQVASVDGHVEVRVRNEGISIASNDRDRIFEPFVRGARENAEGRPGVGLGLAIARQIARSHGGDVRLGEPVPNATEFIVGLPGPYGRGALARTSPT
jgi:signal transduction histidine kinase